MHCFTLGLVPNILKTAILLFVATLVASCNRTPPNSTAGLELVMEEGMTITAQTETGTIAITAGPGLDRTYSWEGASRSATLDPRTERWYGSLGAYFPGPGD